MESKLLRKLAKIAGFPPQNVYRQRPADLQEMLKEKWPDIDEWDAAKATEGIEAAAAEATPKQEEEVKTVETKKEEPKPSPKKAKRTRRTKAQIAADKKAAEKQEEVETKSVVKDKSLPTRRRKKKAPPQNTLENMLLGKLALLDERLTNIETALAQQGSASLGGAVPDAALLKDIASFLAWFHNTVDSKDPIASLTEVDWQDCIDAQLKK